VTTQLNPSYTLTLGSQQWTEQLIGLGLTLEVAPRVDALRLQLPASAPLSAERGDPVTLELDNGEASSTVFTGEIDTISRRLDAVIVTCANASGVLARLRPAETYENASASTVIRSLCDVMGVSVGSLEDGPDLRFYVADPSRTAWEHVARLAAWSGATARVAEDNSLVAAVIDASRAELALRYGRELSSLAVRKQLASPNFTVAGEAGAGDVNSDDALQETTDFFAGNRPSGPGRDTRWQFEPALRTAKAAATAGAALKRAGSSAEEAGRMKLFLQPAIRPGSIVEVQDLPDGLVSGPIWVTRVHHELGANAASTWVDFKHGGDAFDPSALIGSLLGSVGGLL